MKIIKERAKAALESYDFNIYYHYSELTEDSFKDGYIQGATEQKAIDIDKACECFELAEDWQAWANCDFEYAKQYFRKVMEE